MVFRHQQRTLQAALRCAYAEFARRYPEWVASLFDEHFVKLHVLPILRSAGALGRPAPAALVAYAWAAQLNNSPARQRELAAGALPVATQFLNLVQQAV
jgi:hypothetical protein